MTDLNITKTVKGDGLSVTVRPANYRIGLQRTILTEQARKLEAERGEPDNAVLNGQSVEQLAGSVIGVMIYPALIAATVEHEGFEHWPPSAAEVMDLPEPFVADWERAVYSLNPHWVINEITPASAEKKAPIG